MKNFKPTNPVISVVIPAYNEEKYLPFCLKSLKNQDFGFPYEIIVVDNNSSDKTAEIAKNAGVRVVSEKNLGISSARQKGTEAARATLIAQTDADCIPPKKWLSEIYKSFLTNKNTIAVSGLTHGDDPSLKSKITIKIVNSVVFRIIPFLKGNGVFRGSNVAFYKRAWKKAGGYDGQVKWLDDVDFGQRLGKIGKIVVNNNTNMDLLMSTRRLKGTGYFKCYLAILKELFKIYILRNKSLLNDIINYR